MFIVLIDIGLIALGITVGLVHSKRILRRDCSVNLDHVHRHLGSALWLSIACGVALGAGIIVISSEELLWRTPVDFEVRIPSILWALILIPMSYLGTVAVAVAFKSHDKRRKSLAIALPVLLFAFTYIHWSMRRPIAAELTHITDGNGIILQSTGVSCVAASSANILNRFGMEKTEAELADILGTTATGTSPAQVVVGMRKLDVSCRRASFDSPNSVPFPSMLFVDDPVAGPEGHAVALINRTSDGTCEVWDPLDGRHNMTPKELMGIWHGRAVVFDRPN